MKMLLRVCAIAVVLTSLARALSLAQSDSTQAGPPPPPPARQIPGLNAPDPHPNGCVDCHVVMKEFNMDVRISTLMSKWTEGVEPALLEKAKAAAADPATIKGKHPSASGSLKNIPGACLICHKKDSKTAPPFAQLLHTIHLTGGEQNPFMTYYQGDCTHCHKVDAASGKWSIPSGAEK